MLQVVLTLLSVLALVVPTGRYLYRIMAGGPAPLDGLFLPIERFIYKLIGLKDPQESMGWKAYVAALLVSNAMAVAILYLVLRLQGYLPWNQHGFPGMEPSLSFNTAISFITTTNIQHYSGEGAASNLTQMVLPFMMFMGPATGFVATVAFIRGLVGLPLGNFWSDITRIVVRLLLPLALLLALLFVWQGTPQTLASVVHATTLEGATQKIVVGPVASLLSIKMMGNNGGGFFGANSAHPFENPTPLTNLLQVVLMLWLPTSGFYMFGLFARNKKQGWVFFAAASILFVILLSTALHFEAVGNPALHTAGLAGPSMEGKEVRFGSPESALYATVTTATETGAVNAMHDSLAPMTGFAALVNMMLNSVFGGKGVGLMSVIATAMIAVFLVGLMVGRTPEFLQKKLETREIVLLAIVILYHPLLILGPSALSLIVPAAAQGISHTGFHGLSQVLYEFSSAAANNGSEFAGLSANTAWWNIIDGVVMLLGRYVSIIALLAVAGFLAAKKPVPEGPGTLRTDTPLFAVVLVGVIMIVGALTFFPALALGPIAEHLTLFAGK